jgi:hypothetical protein
VITWQGTAGPAHGMRVAIPGDPLDPPATYEMQQASTRQGAEPRRLVYRKGFTTLDKATWVYRYEEQAL